MFKEIENEKELKVFLEKIDYLHDGVLQTLLYVSGSYGDKNGVVPNDDKREIILTIQGCACGEIVLKFCGVIKCNIIPTIDNFSSEIFQSNIQIVDNNFIFAQEVDDINDKIKNTKHNKTTIISERLSYKIIAY